MSIYMSINSEIIRGQKPLKTVNGDWWSCPSYPYQVSHVLAQNSDRKGAIQQETII